MKARALLTTDNVSIGSKFASAFNEAQREACAMRSPAYTLMSTDLISSLCVQTAIIRLSIFTRLEARNRSCCQLNFYLFKHPAFSRLPFSISDKINFRRSKDEDIPLVDVEQFLNEASEELRAKAADGEHHRHLARLEWELERRKQLEEQLKLNEKTKRRLEEEIRTKSKTLDKLRPMLKSVVDSIELLHQHLQLPKDGGELSSSVS